MVNCPRCAQPVDENVRNRCPLCFTSIPQSTVLTTPEGGNIRGVQLGLAGAPAFANYTPEQTPMYPNVEPQGFMKPLAGLPPQPVEILQPRTLAAGARVSFTGEVIDPNDPIDAPPRYVAGAPTRGNVNRMGMDAVARPVNKNERFTENSDSQSKSGGIVGILMFIIVAGCIGFLGFYLWTHRTNPKDQAILALSAFAKKDWKAAYDLISLGEAGKKQFPDPEAFGKQANKIFQSYENNPLTKSFIENLSQAADHATAGEPIISGDKAEVPTSMTVSGGNADVQVVGKAHMINQGGLWKLDMTSESQTNRDKTARDLIGKPQITGFGG